MRGDDYEEIDENEDYDDFQYDELQDQVEQSKQNNNIINSIKKVGKGTQDTANNVKKGVNAAKVTAKTVADMLKGLVQIIASLPPPVLIALVVILIAIIIFFSIKGLNKESGGQINSSVKTVVNTKLEETKNGTITSGEEIARIEKAYNYYEKENSFIYFTIDELNEAYETYVDEYEYSTNDIGQPTYASMSTVYGTDELSDSEMSYRIVDVNQKLPLYKHMLMTEKYNFNKVQWKWFGHGHAIYGDTMTDADMVLDKELGLKYPNDGKSKLDTFVSLLMPYLETWHIPLAVNSGSITNGTDGKAASQFTYSAIKDAYSYIVAHRYDVQKYILNTTFKDYIQTELKSQIKMYVKITETYKAQTTGTVEVGEGMIGSEESYGEYTIDTSIITSLENSDEVLNSTLISYIDMMKTSDTTHKHLIAKFQSGTDNINYNSTCSSLEITQENVSAYIYKIDYGINNQSYTIKRMERRVYYINNEWKNSGTISGGWDTVVANGKLYFNIGNLVAAKVNQIVSQKNSETPNMYYAARYTTGIKGFGESTPVIDKEETFKNVPRSGEYWLVTYKYNGGNTYEIVSRKYWVKKDEYKRDGDNYIYDLYYKYEYTGDSVVKQIPVYDYGELGGDYDNTRVPGQIRSTRLEAGTTAVTKDPVASAVAVSKNEVIDPMLEEFVSDSTQITNRYNVKTANTFDIKVDVSLAYNRYLDEDANNRVNAKKYKETVEDYKNTLYEENKIDSSELHLYKNKTLSELENNTGLELLYDISNFHSNSDISDIYNLLKNISPGTEVKKESNISKADEPGTNGRIDSTHLRCNEYIKRDSYVVQEGKKENNQGLHYVERTWEDEFRVAKYKNTTYTIEDLVEFNAKYNSNLNGTSEQIETTNYNELSESTFSNINSYTEYTDLETNTQLNNIRFINSNKNIFNKYLSNTDKKSQSDIEGYSNEWMQLVFDEMKSLFEEKSQKSGTSPYIYGISLGLTTKVSAGTPLDATNNYTTYVWPVPDKMEVSYLFGYTIAYYGKNKFHNGIDISIEGASVIAAASGTVTQIVNDIPNGTYIEDSYGNYIKIQHADGTSTLYAHLAQGCGSDLTIGGNVQKGKEIGITDTTGQSIGYHLHFSIFDESGEAIDPMQFFKCEPNLDRYPAEGGYTIPLQAQLDEINPATGETYRYGISEQDSYIVVGGAGASEEFMTMLHTWEGGSAPIEKDGVLYYIIEDDGKGHETVGRGIDIFNGGFEQLFIDAGYPTEMGGLVPVEFVDSLEALEIEEKTAQIIAEVGGLNLTEYQLSALVSRAYNCGVAGAVGERNGMTFEEAYNEYWVGNETTEIDFEHPFYVNYMSKPNTSEGDYMLGLDRRRRAEWIYFVTGTTANNGDDRIGI